MLLPNKTKTAPKVQKCLPCAIHHVIQAIKQLLRCRSNIQRRNSGCFVIVVVALFELSDFDHCCCTGIMAMLDLIETKAGQPATSVGGCFRDEERHQTVLQYWNQLGKFDPVAKRLVQNVIVEKAPSEIGVLTLQSGRR